METPSFRVPRKAILTKEHLTTFQESRTYKELIDYITKLNESVTNVKLTDTCTESEVPLARACHNHIEGQLIVTFAEIGSEMPTIDTRPSGGGGEDNSPSTQRRIAFRKPSIQDVL
jgi:hypothetical protein